MAQHDYIIANGSGSAVRGDLNNALAAIVSNNSGSSEPSPTYAYQWWADTTTGLLKIRNAANNAWITLRELDGTLTIEAGTVSAPGLYFTGDTNTGIYSPAADRFAIATNGVERVEWGTSEAVFNDGGDDYDFRIEGDTKANLLLVDASADTVSVDGTAQLANQTPLRFGDSDNSHYVALRAAATVAANVTWDLPSADGTAGQVLKTDGSGVLGFSAETLPGVAGTLDRLNRAGNILQVVQSTYATSTSITSTSFTDTGLSATITPSSATSKILVCATFNALVTNTANTANAAIQLLRGSTVIYSLLNGANNNGFLSINAGLGSGSVLYLVSTASLKYLDSPATTSAVTYKTQGRINAAGPTVTFQPGDDTAIMILMEVAA